jgi:hypothetical protein
MPPWQPTLASDEPDALPAQPAPPRTDTATSAMACMHGGAASGQILHVRQQPVFLPYRQVHLRYGRGLAVDSSLAWVGGAL